MRGLAMIICLVLEGLTDVIIDASSNKGLFSWHMFWESSPLLGYTDVRNQQETTMPASSLQLLGTCCKREPNFLIQSHLQPVCQCLGLSQMTCWMQDFVLATRMKNFLFLITKICISLETLTASGGN